VKEMIKKKMGVSPDEYHLRHRGFTFEDSDNEEKTCESVGMNKDFPLMLKETEDHIMKKNKPKPKIKAE